MVGHLATALARVAPSRPAVLPLGRRLAFAPSARPMVARGIKTSIQALQGVEKEVKQPGNGPKPEKGQKVTVHYTGTLTNGQKFDSSRDRGQPFSFTLGVGQVIRGWDEGVATMSVGERSILKISSDYGYGARGAGGVIPPNADLIFDVELLRLD